VTTSECPKQFNDAAMEMSDKKPPQLTDMLTTSNLQIPRSFLSQAPPLRRNLGQVINIQVPLSTNNKIL